MILLWNLLLCLGSTLAAKVLFMPSTIYPVHSYTMKHLADELASRGHQVTWLEYGPVQSKTVLSKDVKRVYWPVQYEDRTLQKLFVDKTHPTHELIWEPDFDLPNEQTTAWLASIRLCDKLLQNKKDKFDALVKEKFDTVIVDDLYNPCGLLQVALKGSVYIYWSMTSMRTESAWANQSPSPPSYLPVPGTMLTDELSFSERIYNLASYLKALYIHQHLVHNRIDAVFQKYYPGVGSAFDIERNASINFVNNPPIFDFARPYMPRVNFVGGLHCHNATTLEGPLGKFVDGSSEKEGFVVISTGFTAEWEKAPVATKSAFLSAIRAHPNIRFVWQYNGNTLEKIPSNLMVQEWIPLQNLLGHSKCRAHISHGGLNSVIESVWHGVPVIGFPLTVKGHDNLLRVTARGAGILLTKAELNEESLANAITEIYDKKYKEEMLVFQDMLRDVPYSELTHAAFWVEFIDRHQEVPHARSGADKLNILQYFLVDVILFMLSILAVLVATVVFLVKLTWRIVAGSFNLFFGRKKSKPVQRVTKSKKRN